MEFENHKESWGWYDKVDKKKPKTTKKNGINNLSISTYPTSFTLVFECFFGILCCSLDVIHCMFDVIFYTVDHFTLIVYSYWFESGFKLFSNFRWRNEKRNIQFLRNL